MIPLPISMHTGQIVLLTKNDGWPGHGVPQFLRFRPGPDCGWVTHCVRTGSGSDRIVDST